MEIHLRDFRKQDFEAVWRIDQQCFAPGISYSRIELAAYLTRPGAFALVAEPFEAAKAARQGKTASADGSASDILGFIVAESASRNTGHIITIDVHPRARAAGVGSRSLSAAENRLRAANCGGVILETAVDNLAALSFYKKHDYSVVRTIPRYYSDDVDALVLKKDLLFAAPAS